MFVGRSSIAKAAAGISQSGEFRRKAKVTVGGNSQGSSEANPRTKEVDAESRDMFWRSVELGLAEIEVEAREDDRGVDGVKEGFVRL